MTIPGITAIIAALQKEKRSQDPVPEPIIVQNVLLQNAFSQIETAIDSISITIPVPVNQGGTGNTGYAANGLLQITGAPVNPVVSTVPQIPITSGTVPVMDTGSGGLGTLGTFTWYRIGDLVWLFTVATWPGNLDGNFATIGHLPYVPIRSIQTNFVTNGGVSGFLVFLANASNANFYSIAEPPQPFINTTFSTNSMQFFIVYQTSDPP
jgi:hypothetical protein